MVSVPNRLHWTCPRTLQHAIGQICLGRYEIGIVCTGSRLLYVRDGHDMAWHCSCLRSRQQIYAQPGTIALERSQACVEIFSGHKRHGILFGMNKSSGVVGYTNSDFAGCVDNQKSTIGYCFKFGNGAISECTTTWTTKAKYVALSDAANEALCLGWLANTFRQVDSDLAPVVYDS